MTFRPLSKKRVALGCLLLAATAPGAARAGSQTLWKLGAFDESPGEFTKAIAYTNPAQDLVFAAGKSDPAKDWCAFQPGSGNGRFGPRAHPFTINFEIPGAPAGLYSLKLGLFADSASLPALQLEINGHRGQFYLRPRLSFTPGNSVPINSYSSMVARIPARYFNKGANKLVLTAIDDATPNRAAVRLRPRIRVSPTTRSSSITTPAPNIPPTISGRRRFRRSSTNPERGALVEIVDVFVTAGDRLSQAEVVLSVGGQKFSKPLQSGNEFGEHRLEFEVPEFHSDVKGEVAITSGGHSSRFPVTHVAGQEVESLRGAQRAPGHRLTRLPHQGRGNPEPRHRRSHRDDPARIRTSATAPMATGRSSSSSHGRSPEQRQKLFDLVAQKKIFVAGAVRLQRHRFREPRRHHPLALSQLPVSLQARRRFRLRQHHRRAFSVAGRMLRCWRRQA